MGQRWTVGISTCCMAALLASATECSTTNVYVLPDASSCGAIGQPCCANASCTGGAACIAGSCVAPDGGLANADSAADGGLPSDSAVLEDGSSPAHRRTTPRPRRPTGSAAEL